MVRNELKIENIENIEHLTEHTTENELSEGEYICGWCGFVVSVSDYSCKGCKRDLLFFGENENAE